MCEEEMEKLKKAGCGQQKGVEDGDQKGGDSLQPAQENRFNYTKIDI